MQGTATPLIQLSRDGAHVNATEQVVVELASAFAKNLCIRLEGFLSPEVLRIVDADLSHQSFTEVADDIGAEAQPDMGSTARAVLHLLANDHRLFRFVEAVTACPPLKVFDGRIYRMAAGTGHHDTWHDDFVKDRVVGMSVNLSRAAYGGGTFHIRAKGSESNGTAFPNKGYGDCIMFALGREFEHQVTAVTSGVKTAFAGWYRGAGGFLDNFQSG